MKLLNYIYAIVISFITLVGCTKENMDPLQGKYPAPDDFKYTEVISTSFEKLGVGKRLVTFTIANGASESMTIKLYCEKSVPTSGSYAPIAAGGEFVAGKYIMDSGEGGTFCKSANGVAPINYGTINITKDGNSYKIDGVLKSGENYIKVAFKGEILFEEENDVPSGYTFVNKRSPVFEYDASYNPLLVPGVASNVITIANPNGEVVAELTVITSDNATSLVGRYTITENAKNAGEAANGFYIPDWNFGGGSYLVIDGVKNYISAGSFDITVIDNGLVTIKGEGLTAMATTGAVSTINFEYFNMQNLSNI